MIRGMASSFVPLTPGHWMRGFLPSSQTHNKFASRRLGQMPIL